MICPICGTEVEAESVLCFSCGYEFSDRDRKRAKINLNKADDNNSKNDISKRPLIQEEQLSTISLSNVDLEEKNIEAAKLDIDLKKLKDKNDIRENIIEKAKEKSIQDNNIKKFFKENIGKDTNFENQNKKCVKEKHISGKVIVIAFSSITIIAIIVISFVLLLRRNNLPKENIEHEVDDTNYEENVKVSDSEEIAEKQNLEEKLMDDNNGIDKDENKVKDEFDIDLSNYVGSWGISGNDERELTIKNIDDKQVVFSLCYYRLTSIDDVVAIVNGNEAVFTVNSYDGVVSGNLFFVDNTVKVNILKSEQLYMPPENLVFDVKHFESWSDQTNETSLQDYILPQSDSVILKETDLIGLSKDELRLARNEIYARHGRMFSSEDLQEYFDKQSWYLGYIPMNEFSEELLNEIERANVNTIKAYENSIE